MDKPTLQNRYFLMRHGYAESNALRIYSTNPDFGLTHHPLTPEGHAQVSQSISVAAPNYHLDNRTLILASPILRAKQTAEIVADYLKCPAPIFDIRLRERFCGEFDTTFISESPAPHRQADTSIDSNFRGVENLHNLWTRMHSVVLDAEKSYQNQTIIIVSHGDPLECLYCGLQNSDLLTFHTAFPHFQNAEIRPAHLS